MQKVLTTIVWLNLFASSCYSQPIASTKISRFVYDFTNGQADTIFIFNRPQVIRFLYQSDQVTLLKQQCSSLQVLNAALQSKIDLQAQQVLLLQQLRSNDSLVLKLTQAQLQDCANALQRANQTNRQLTVQRQWLVGGLLVTLPLSLAYILALTR